MSDVRNPIWRKGGVVFPPTPRDYSFSLPKKVAKGALREALAFKVQAGAVRVVDALSLAAPKTKAAVSMLKGLGATGKTLILDLAVDPVARPVDAQHRRPVLHRRQPRLGALGDGRRRR